MIKNVLCTNFVAQFRLEQTAHQSMLIRTIDHK